MQDSAANTGDTLAGITENELVGADFLDVIIEASVRQLETDEAVMHMVGHLTSPRPHLDQKIAIRRKIHVPVLPADRVEAGPGTENLLIPSQGQSTDGVATGVTLLQVVDAIGSDGEIEVRRLDD